MRFSLFFASNFSIIFATQHKCEEMEAGACRSPTAILQHETMFSCHQEQTDTFRKITRSILIKCPCKVVAQRLCHNRCAVLSACIVIDRMNIAKILTTAKQDMDHIYFLTIVMIGQHSMSFVLTVIIREF